MFIRLTFVLLLRMVNQSSSDEYFKLTRHVHVTIPVYGPEPYEKIHSQLSSFLKSMEYTGFITAEVIHNSLFSYNDFINHVATKMAYFYD